MTTFPPAPLAYQLMQLLTYQDSQIAYVGYEGTIFHLSGPLAPVLGAQTGAAIVSIQGIDPSFRHLDNKGARQDGTTWYDTLYDPGEIAMTIELSGMSPSDMRNVIASWWGGWDTKQVGRLCWFSPERGEWWCNVRQGRNVQNTYQRDWYQSGRVQFNWVARNDAAFWQSVDSVCVYGNNSNVLKDDFDRLDNSDLGPEWKQTYTGGGLCATPNPGVASWIAGGGNDGSVINQFIGNGFQSANGHAGNDHQIVSVTLAEDMPLPTVNVLVTVSATAGTFNLLYGGQTTTDIAYNASTSAVASALSALSSIGSGNATVIGTPGSYTVTLSNDVPIAGSLEADGSGLTGTITVFSPGANVAVDFSTLGSAWVYEVARATGGTYTLSYNGHTTANIPYNAAGSAVVSALEALAGIGSGNVTVYTTFADHYHYMIEFSNSVVTSTLTSDGTHLTGGIINNSVVTTPMPALPDAQVSWDPAGPTDPTWYTNHVGSGSGGGWAVANGAATWLPGSGGAQGGVNIYQVPTDTDNQSVSVTISGTLHTEIVGIPPLTVQSGGPVLSIQAKANAVGSTYVFANVYSDRVQVGVVNQGHSLGQPDVLNEQPLAYAPGTYTLQCDGINYILLRNGAVVAHGFDTGGLAHNGELYRYTGFGGYVQLIGFDTPGAVVNTFSSFDNHANTFLDIWGRMDTDASGQNGVRARFGYDWASLSVLIAGTLTQVWSGKTTAKLAAGDVLALQCGVTQPGAVGKIQDLMQGTNRHPNQFQLFHNGAPLIVATGKGVVGRTAADIENYFGIDYGREISSAQVGADFRGWGWGMTAAGAGGTQIGPPGIAEWAGGSDSGFISLTNMGDQPAWPRYLCYGPGTFAIGDSDTGNMITFGPLLAGQVALLVTLPRLQNVVDVTPSSSVIPVNTPNGVQKLVEGIVNFVTNNNVPPLLEQFESLFGILPPQGPLYSLLDGRFVTPIAPMVEQVGPTTTVIPIQIQGGNSQSKVIAAVTPLRRWPE